jgi:hypothetical protein
LDAAPTVSAFLAKLVAAKILTNVVDDIPMRLWVIPRCKIATLADASLPDVAPVATGQLPSEAVQMPVLVESNAKLSGDFGLSYFDSSNLPIPNPQSQTKLYAAPNSACKASSLSSAIVATTVIAREISPAESSATVRELNTTT